MNHHRGFMTLTSLGFLLLAAAWAGAMALHLQSVTDQAHRRNLRQEASAELLAGAAQAVALAQEWDQKRQTWLQAAGAYEGPGTLTPRDHGARLNLNWINRFILEQSALKDWLLAASQEPLEVFRSRTGPAADLNSYSDYFSPEALERFFTPWTPLNINTADEFMISRTASLRGLSGEYFREKAVDLRIKLVHVPAEGLEDFTGEEGRRMIPFWAAGGELNINTCDDFLLFSLLTYGPWEISGARGRYDSLTQIRKTRLILQDEIPGLTGVSPSHPLMSYLGAVSTVVEALITTEQGSLRLILYKNPSTSGPGSVRILRQERPDET